VGFELWEVIAIALAERQQTNLERGELAAHFEAPSLVDETGTGPVVSPEDPRRALGLASRGHLGTPLIDERLGLVHVVASRSGPTGSGFDRCAPT
jgi:hypothetical protein